MMARAILLLALLAAQGAAALDLPVAARIKAEDVSPLGRYAAPVGVFADGTLPVREIEGRVERRAWIVPLPETDPMRLIDPLVAEFEADGYLVVLDCLSEVCGGFDFRFATEVLPAPAMFVTLDDYRFVTALSGPEDAPDRAVTLLASGAAEGTYLQAITATRRPGATGSVQGAAPQSAVSDRTEPGTPDAGNASGGTVEQAPGVPTGGQAGAGAADAGGLFINGSAVLEGLQFDTGATTLDPGPFAALETLAAYLRANPDRRVALVGHTDTVGPLAPNITISRNRAAAVRQRLIDSYGIAPGRIDAEGMGYLAPRASNATEAGREANRRVEAVLLESP